jgi:hypothetical protein
MAGVAQLSFINTFSYIMIQLEGLLLGASCIAFDAKYWSL